MKIFQLKKMEKGWFIGNFFPTALQTSACEVAVKSYSKGDTELKHFHKIATEVTVILSGSVMMFEKKIYAGSIVIIEPNEETSFEALENSTTIVVKVPGAENDKYLSQKKPKKYS